MQIKQCRRCSKAFFTDGTEYVCQECKAKNESEFGRIEEYLMEHPGSNAMQLSAALNIPVTNILMYLKEGKLECVKKK